jgi:hypothetical protein
MSITKQSKRKKKPKNIPTPKIATAMTMIGPPMLKGRPSNLRRPINPSRELSYVDKWGASGVLFFIGVFSFLKGSQLID